MPRVAAKVWSQRRKWLGNLVPGLVLFIVGGIGAARTIQTLDFFGWGTFALLGSILLSAFALNYFGFFENDKMQKELREKLTRAGNEIPAAARFVGFASPGFQSMLDPHQDIGFLIIRDQHLEFLGEDRKISLPKGTIKTVGFRMNIHSIFGLGRWVAIGAVLDGKPVRLQIEPRTHRTLLQNKKEGKTISAEIRRWITGSGPRPKSGAA